MQPTGPFKTFKVTYTNRHGERIVERPCRVISADGRQKMLLIGQSDFRLAAVDSSVPDGELWKAAFILIEPFRKKKLGRHGNTDLNPRPLKKRKK